MMARNGLRIVYPFDVTLEVDSLYTHWFAILCSSVQTENCLTYLLFLQRAVSLFVHSYARSRAVRASYPARDCEQQASEVSIRVRAMKCMNRSFYTADIALPKSLMTRPAF